MLTILLLLFGFGFVGAAITASLLTRKHNKSIQSQSDYWRVYWYDHYDEIRQTGITREQLDRLQKLYTKANDL